mmetsp:Transcript_4231/g.7533  ORF Transcript_4231/g.7533 Transcript_4231/m.7533 type:complete len:220 (-) Transcript_4231:1392-2051(-)
MEVHCTDLVPQFVRQFERRRTASHRESGFVTFVRKTQRLLAAIHRRPPPPYHCCVPAAFAALLAVENPGIGDKGEGSEARRSKVAAPQGDRRHWVAERTALWTRAPLLPLTPVQVHTWRTGRELQGRIAAVGRRIGRCGGIERQGVGIEKRRKKKRMVMVMMKDIGEEWMQQRGTASRMAVAVDASTMMRIQMQIRTVDQCTALYRRCFPPRYHYPEEQ